MREFEYEKIDLGYDDLVADTQPTGRTYITPDGSRFPSITTVLNILSEEYITAWRSRVGEEEANKVSHRASTRGTLVHSILEKYLLNEDTTKFLPHIKQSLENIRPILDENITKIYGLEVPLYSRHLGVAGRCDCISVFDGVPSIVDFKTSSKIKTEEMAQPWYHQMTAYAIMVEELTGQPIEEVNAIVSMEDGQYQVFTADPKDYVESLYGLRQQYRSLYGV